MPGISAISILAGIVGAYGTFAVVAAIAGAVANRADTNTDFRTNDWTGNGAKALLISAVTLFIAYLFGGYIAGRMARRRGVAHGVAVFVVSLILAAIAGALVKAFTDNADIRRNLRSIGAPTTWNQVSDVAIVGVIVALAAMLLGAILGGMLGDRWHAKLERRAADPAYGPDTQIRREVGPSTDDDDRREPVRAGTTDRAYEDDRGEAGSAYDRSDGTYGSESADRESYDRDRGAFEGDRNDYERSDYGRNDYERSDYDRDGGETVEPGIGQMRRTQPVDEPENDRTRVGGNVGRDVPRD